MKLCMDLRCRGRVWLSLCLSRLVLSTCRPGDGKRGCRNFFRLAPFYSFCIVGFAKPVVDEEALNALSWLPKYSKLPSTLANALNLLLRCKTTCTLSLDGGGYKPLGRFLWGWGCLHFLSAVRRPPPTLNQACIDEAGWKTDRFLETAIQFFLKWLLSSLALVLLTYQSVNALFPSLALSLAPYFHEVNKQAHNQKIIESLSSPIWAVPKKFAYSHTDNIYLQYLKPARKCNLVDDARPYHPASIPSFTTPCLSISLPPPPLYLYDDQAVTHNRNTTAQCGIIFTLIMTCVWFIFWRSVASRLVLCDIGLFVVNLGKITLK